MIKLLRPCRIGLSFARSHFFAQSTKPLSVIHSVSNIVYNSDVIRVRTMAQKSITSFFKITPKKTAEVKKETQAASPCSPDSSSNVESEPSPVTNGKEKEMRGSKRQQLESSDDNSQSPKPVKRKSSPISSEKKKKSKRQRIESSESESESPSIPPKTEPESPNHQKSKQPESLKEEKIEIKVEKSPKTYSSPKTKKAKTKPVKKSPLVEKNKKTPSPVKKEKSPEKKVTKEKNEKNPAQKMVMMSGFVRKENGVKEEEQKDGVVAEKDYNPAKPKYHPINDACWSKGQEVPYLALAKTLEAIEGTSARLKIVEILSNYYRSVIALTPEDLLPSVYMCLNQLAPAYHSLELGIAETYLMKAIGQCTGRTLAQVKSLAAKSGDLGLVGEQARATQRTMLQPPPLTTRKVFNVLSEIAHMTGQASVNKKISKIQTLYIACRYSEARYLIRSLEGKLRIGLAEQSVLQALAVATALTPPGPDGVTTLDATKGLSAEQVKAKIDEQSLLIKTTYCECPNYDMMIPALLQHGVAALPQHCRLTPGIPLKPMLAHPTKGLHEDRFLSDDLLSKPRLPQFIIEVFGNTTQTCALRAVAPTVHVLLASAYLGPMTNTLNRFENQEFTCEWKYDGERAQIHVPGDESPDFTNAAIFSRNQENNTSKYPDILKRLPKLLKDDVTSCVLDTEAVAYDVEKKQILPFQILSTRKRKDAVEADIKVQVCVFVFDLLYLNGRALVREPLAARRELLMKHFNEVEGEWQFATSKDCSSMEEVQQFLDESIAGSCEGLMVKMLNGENARYDIARRSHNWLKLKKDYLDGIGDTIDAVVIGAYRGKGKRTGVFGGFLLACVDSSGEEYQTLCKIGTGFSDEDLKNLTATLQEHVIDGPKSYYRYDTGHTPDVWLSAACVWEVRCADLSLSPAHHAAIGIVDPDKGISLRFPRFIRVRDDKTPEQATSAQQIADMYLSQDQVKNTASKVTNMDDFY